jgi:NDP-sugar pyrophosphorylase family protein
MKAMILAAGLGTRFKPWTDQHPKALAVINGKSLLERNIYYLQQFGIFDVLVNVHHFAEQIIDAIETNDAWGSRITISDEADEVLETGGGLKKAAWFLNDAPFVLMNADILTDLNLDTMTGFHERRAPLATLAVTNRSSSRYFLFDNEDQLCGWRNIKTGEERLVAGAPQKSGSENHEENITAPGPGTEKPSFPLNEKAFSGIHIISPAIFPLMNQQGKFSMVEVYLQLAATHKILGFDHSGSKLVDVGRQEAVAAAETLFP